MDPLNLRRRSRGLKAASGAIGIGAIIVMGAVTVAHPTSAVGTSSDRWTAEQNVTLVPAIRAQPSFRPQYIVDPCDWATDHMRMHHNC